MTFTEAARDDALSNERYGEAYGKTVASSSKLFPKNINANKQTIEIQYHYKIWLFYIKKKQASAFLFSLNEEA